MGRERWNRNGRPSSGLDQTWADQARFYGGYLAAMALYGSLWLVAPAWSLFLFLGITMYHVGQADLAYWPLPPLSARLFYLSRGLFLLGLPIVAFSVFGAWHALGHVLEMLRFFRRRGEAMSVTQFYRAAFLFTALPFVGLAGLYAVTQSFGLENQMIALLFILIAIMTLPHMVVVEKLYREREKNEPTAVF